MRADLAIDLKITIDTEISVAELNRSIERAYSDMSRFLPDEKIYEDSHQFAVADEELTFPKDTSLDAVVKDEDLNAAAAGSTAPLDGQPDVPRPLTATITDPNLSINGMVITINGTDKDDQGLQETYTYIRGDSKTIVGKKYFKNVLQIDFVQLSGGGPGDLLDIGYGAYTDVWVYLAHSPIKWQSESATNNNDSDAAVVRNTDFYIDYANGRVKAIYDATSPGIDAEDTCTFAYKKSQIGIDISNLPDLIRVQRVEYPIGQIPQCFVQGDTFGKYYVVTGMGESEEQRQMAEDQQYRIYYDAKHQVAGEYSPGTEPSFLTDTVLMAAAAYALYIYALKQEHQAATDIASARTALGNATGTHSALGLLLTDMKKYLDDNEGEDAAGMMSDITGDAENLRTAIIEAANQVNTYLDSVATELTDASDVRKKYINTTDYVAGDTEPDILAYLKAGDALLNTVAAGGEGTEVMESYRRYAETVKSALVGAYENDRAMYVQSATARTNAAMVFAQEVAQRISYLRTFIERAASHVAVVNTFGIAAGHRLSQVVSYLQQASQYIGAAATDTALADRFRAEADERRNEVYNIWRDRKQYIGDFTAGSMRQMPDYK